ncbi:MAG: transglycosylase SLT domain-containing protein [Candidatus Woesearchaeota archaeon]
MRLKRINKEEEKRNKAGKIVFAFNLLVTLVLFFMVAGEFSLFSNMNLDRFSRSLLTGHAVSEIPTMEDLGLSVETRQEIERYSPLIASSCSDAVTSPDERSECIYLLKTFISVSSEGNEDYISHIGRAGIIPLSEEISQRERFGDVFGKIVSCCSPNGKREGDCSFEPGCSPEPESDEYDDRFDPEKNIEVAARYVMSLYSEYHGNLYLITTAFFSDKDTSDKILYDLPKRRSINMERILNNGESHLDEYSRKLIHQEGIMNVDIYEDMKSILEKSELFYSFWAKKILGESPSYSDIVSQFGLYKINPSFSVYLDYDLSEYEQIIQDAEALVEECSGKPDLDICIDDMIEEFGSYEIPSAHPDDEPHTDYNYRWNYGSCNSDEEYLETLYEDFMLCLDSDKQSESCFCRLSLDNLPEDSEIILEKGTKFGNDMIRLRYERDGNIFSKEIVNPSGNLNLCYFRNRGGFAEFFGAEDEYVTDADEIILRNSNGEISIPQFGRRPLLNKLYKIDSGTLCFAPADSENNPVVDRTDLQCSSQRLFHRFCVESSQELFSTEYLFGREEYMAAYEPVKYKFALYFRDDPPPKITGVRFYDKPKDSDSAIIMFDKSPAEDIDHYDIYYQDVDMVEELMRNTLDDGNLKYLNEMSTTEMDYSDYVNKVTIQFSSAEENALLSMPYSFDCDFDYENMICMYPVNPENTRFEGMTFEDDLAYSFENSGKYLYSLPLQKDTEYLIGIVGVDSNGNKLSNSLDEMITIEELNSNIIKDDLEYGPVSMVAFTGDTLSWMPPQTYENGEELDLLDEPESYTILYYEYEGDEMGACDVSGVGKNMMRYRSYDNVEETSINIILGRYVNDGGKYCFGVLAERGEGRVINSLSNPEDYESAENLVRFSLDPNFVPLE